MPVGNFYDDAIQGGRFDNVNVTVTSASVETRKSENTGNDYTALFMEWEVEGSDESRRRVVVIGNPEQWGATEDKRDVIQADSGARWNRKSPIYQFLTDLINAGYTKDDINNRALADLVDGGVFHIMTRPDGRKYTGNDGKEHDSTEPYIDKVVTFPWEAKKSGSKGKAKAAAASADSGDTLSDDEIRDEITALVLEKTAAASESSKPYLKSRLAVDLVMHFKANADAKKRAPKLLDPKFLESIDGINYDGSKFTIA